MTLARTLLSPLTRRRWPAVLLCAHLVAAAILLVRVLGWLQPAELAAYDRLVAGHAGEAVSDRIILVTVTEADLARHGWPLRDQHLADLVERLLGWGVRSIGVDIYRDRPEPPGEAALAALLSRRPEVFWVLKLGDAAAAGIPPPAALAGSPRAVMADVLTDAGGVVRRGLLAATDPRTGRTLRAMGTALAEHAVGERLRSAGEATLLGGGRVPLIEEERFGPYAQVDASGYQMLLDFHGGRGRFRKVTLEEVTRDDALAPLLRDRIVLVGTEAESVKDSFATPLGPWWKPGEPALGVALHAYLADQLIRIHAGERAGWRALPPAAEAGIAWACALLAALAVLAFPGALPAAAILLGGLGLVLAGVQAGFGRGLLLPGVPAMLAWAGAAGSAVWVLHAFDQRERLQLRRSFEHYLDPRIIDAMLSAGTLPQFGGEHREITVLFSDIANFTSMAETMPPDQVAAILQDYFDGLCAAILDAGGLVTEFAGDSVLALFGAPQRQPDHADRAVEAALGMDAFAGRFRAMQRARGVAFGATRIGLHTGVALVGNIGTRARLKYGAIGDVMNTASRIEGLNKRVGTRIAVSGETARLCTRHRFRPVGEFVLAGRRAALPVTTPLRPGEPPDGPRLARYEAAYAALRSGEEGAAAMFRALREEDPEDPCVAFHCRRLAAGQAGVQVVMESK